MKIAEVSERYGIPQDTLRYYEREGVIPEIKRGNGNIRDYSEEDCKAIVFAQCLKAAGFSVEDIVEYRRLSDMGDGTIPDRLARGPRQGAQVAEPQDLLLREGRGHGRPQLGRPELRPEHRTLILSSHRTSSWRTPDTLCARACRRTA